MGIDIRFLPPEMQRQALQKMIAQQKPASAPIVKAEPKYHNTPTDSRGITFDSAKEARRYDELMLMLRAGTVSDLKLQVNFTLQEGFKTTDGKRIKPIIYKADFTYHRSGELVVEDVKSEATRTKTYLIKKKMLRDKYGIDIEEV